MVSSTERITQAASVAAVMAFVLMRDGSQMSDPIASKMPSLTISTPYQIAFGSLVS